MDTGTKRYLFWFALGSAVAAGLALLIQQCASERREPAARSDDDFDPIQEASIGSFPASDPPSWTGSHAS